MPPRCSSPPELSAPRKVNLDLAPAAYLQRHVGLKRFFTTGPIDPNYGSYFGVAELDANDVPVPTDYAHYVHGRLDPYTDPLLFVGNDSGGRPATAPATQNVLLQNLDNYRDAGTSYVLTPPGQTLPQSPAGLELVFRSPSTWIYHLAGAGPYFSASNPGCRVSPESRTSVRISCPSPTFLLRRETYFPGWSADVDGRSRQVRQADGVFQVVSLGAGSHRVTFSYSPPDENWALVGLLVGVGLLMTPTFLSRRRAAPAAP